jgi:hypothetical protein
VLFGGFGMDNLDGDAPTGIDPSSHFDACVGGPDADTAAHCEAVFGVP